MSHSRWSSLTILIWRSLDFVHGNWMDFELRNHPQKNIYPHESKHANGKSTMIEDVFPYWKKEMFQPVILGSGPGVYTQEFPGEFKKEPDSAICLRSYGCFNMDDFWNPFQKKMVGNHQIYACLKTDFFRLPGPFFIRNGWKSPNMHFENWLFRVQPGN